MKINSIVIKNSGYVYCKSNFYFAGDALNSTKYNFTVGVNRLTGEIDSEIWAVSYLLSMYRHRPKDFVLFDDPSVIVNNKEISLNEISSASCYMDMIHPLFHSKHSARKLVEQGIRKTRINFSTQDIKNIFGLDDERFEKPLSCTGNEVFRAMSAVAFAHDIQIFCFPWMSKKRFDSYHANLTILLEVLEKQNKIVIVPVGETP